MQDEAECLFFLADLHALTIDVEPAELRSNVREMAAALIASGIDPVKSTLFAQSAVPAHAELAWPLQCTARIGWLNRMTQFKEKSGKNRESVSVGLYTYPVLQAADILLYLPTHVPVGEDQKQHVELARDIAGAFNRRYEVDFFPLPEPQIFGEATRVMSLRDGTRKMSKSDTSDYSRLNMTDDADTIALKVRRAKTDPEPLPETIAALEARAVELGAGLGLLLADRLSDYQRRAVGWTLFLIGALTTIPLAFEVLGKSRPAAPAAPLEEARSEPRSEQGQRPERERAPAWA